MLWCGTQRVILFTFNLIISIVRLSEDIYNNTNEDSYNIFRHMGSSVCFERYEIQIHRSHNMLYHGAQRVKLPNLSKIFNGI